MLFVVDHHSGVPVYRQIMDQVRFQIASGTVSAGTELPSTRQLATELGVNPMTVSKAYGLLERDGVLTRRPGKSLVVAERDADAAAENRREQLREELASTATRVRQLGVAPEIALQEFRRLLDDGHDGGD